MDEYAMGDAFERDKSIVELRALLAAYEDRLSRTSERSPDSHASLAPVREPLFLLNDLAIDLRSSSLADYAAIEAPRVVDGFQPQEPEPFASVYRIASGVFRVHPRQGRLSAAVLGPFSGSPPSGWIATAQTTHAAAPPVRFSICTWKGEVDISAIESVLGTERQQARFLTVPPKSQGFLIAADGLQAGAAAAAPESSWSLVLATIADPPEEISFAWAEFRDIALIFSTDSGLEVRPLS